MRMVYLNVALFIYLFLLLFYDYTEKAATSEANKTDYSEKTLSNWLSPLVFIIYGSDLPERHVIGSDVLYPYDSAAANAISMVNSPFTAFGYKNGNLVFEGSLYGL